jgi:hypothetical protein
MCGRVVAVTCSGEEEFVALAGVSRDKRLFRGKGRGKGWGRGGVVGRMYRIWIRLLQVLVVFVRVLNGGRGEGVMLLLLLVIARMREVISLRNLRKCRLLLMRIHESHFDRSIGDSVTRAVRQERLGGGS